MGTALSSDCTVLSVRPVKQLLFHSIYCRFSIALSMWWMEQLARCSKLQLQQHWTMNPGHLTAHGPVHTLKLAGSVSNTSWLCLSG